MTALDWIAVALAVFAALDCLVIARLTRRIDAGESRREALQQIPSPYDLRVIGGGNRGPR